MNLRTYFDQAGRGAQMRLAAVLGVRPPVVAVWVSEKRAVPISRAVAIEHFTGGAVTRKELRPNDWALIWPELADAATSEPDQPASTTHQAPAAI